MKSTKTALQITLVLGGLVTAHSDTETESNLRFVHMPDKQSCGSEVRSAFDVSGGISYLLTKLPASEFCPASEIAMPDLLTLSQAASVGDIDAIQMLLDSGADVNSMDDQPGTGYTALHHASAQGHSIAVRLLLHHNADVDKLGSDGMTPLHLAAQNGHDESVRILLEHGTDVNQRTRLDHMTALHVAAEAGNLPVVRALLHHGADIAAVNEAGNTALHLSAKNGQADVASILLAHKMTIKNYHCTARLIQETSRLCALY
ncbi:hypothetical protein LV157_006615 [Aspergillus fumigatus]|nr:hypothetical protein LV157_006615 [Aspergillus fumigatus]